MLAAAALLLLGGAASAAPSAPATSPPPPPAPPAPRACEAQALPVQQPLPHNSREYEDLVVRTARALSELVSAGTASEARAAALAQAAVAAAPLVPPLSAVALGAPQLKLGLLYFTSPPQVVVFQQNNSASLQQYWRTLASPWNATEVVWSRLWRSCEVWWGGAAAAWGGGAARAAAAIFRQLPTVGCELVWDLHVGGAPACDPRSTECEITASEAKDYRCRCRPDWWSPDGPGWVEGPRLAPGPLECQPCALAPHAAGCAPAAGGRESLRAALLAANLAGMLLTVVIAVVIFKKRKCKAVATGMWTVLLVILLGAFLMYASAGVQHCEWARARCVLGTWLRELGYVACYGAIVLRLWVTLAEFRTRKAHRWTPRDSEVLRVLAAMLIGAACYLAAFTAMAACGEGEGEGATCARAAWHHVTAAAEILLLIAGAKIAHAVRNANVPFQERGWLLTALAVEGCSGVAWRVAAATSSAAPERSAPAATARAQLSAGVALACVFLPRLWHGWRAGRSLAQEVSRRGPAEGFGCEGDEAEPSSEEVRAELKRIYTQLELLRDKTLRHDNPHISKRRGGRKHPHRRFSLQALQARRGAKGRGGAGGETSEGGDASRTPEDSVCSVEGPSHYTDGDTQA